MLRIEGLTYRIGPRTLFENADAAINEGHRVGFVGRNGAGKTTLLNMIMGSILPDTGVIDYPKRWRIGITRQEAPSGSQSLVDTVMSADRELVKLNKEADTATDPNRIAEIHTRLHEKEAHRARSRASRLLAGLGFSEAEMQRPCDEFSGGWRMRVALAGLLFTQPDLLLLDEPTNHLDLEACLWLEDYLKRYRGTILIVSHDRGLLNRVVNQILHLDDTGLKLYTGGYDRFEVSFRAQLERIASERSRQEAQRAHIQKFVDKFRYKATKARQAQSRIKMLERMEPLPERGAEGSVAFTFPNPKALAPPLYSIDNASIGYDGTAILNKVSFRLDLDDRIALLGANGNGKSTLIKLLAGRLEAMSGHVVKSGKLRVGYFAQHQTDELDFDATPLIELSRRRPKDLDLKLRNHLGRFGFSQQRAETRTGDLSGGEKARLLFAMMSSDEPHILLLDEPTNHLDVVAREALIQAINAFEGAVVIVSHDPHVIELTADRLWLVDQGTVTPYDGDLDDYRKLLTKPAKNKDKVGKANEPVAPVVPDLPKKEQRRLAAEKRNGLAPLRKRVKRAEEKVIKLTSESERLQTALAAPELYEKGDTETVKSLQVESGYAAKTVADAEEAWLELQEELETAEVEAAAAS